MTSTLSLLSVAVFAVSLLACRSVALNAPGGVKLPSLLSRQARSDLVEFDPKDLPTTVESFKLKSGSTFTRCFPSIDVDLDELPRDGGALSDGLLIFDGETCKLGKDLKLTSLDGEKEFEDDPFYSLYGENVEGELGIYSTGADSAVSECVDKNGDGFDFDALALVAGTGQESSEPLTDLADGKLTIAFHVPCVLKAPEEKSSCICAYESEKLISTSLSPSKVAGAGVTTSPPTTTEVAEDEKENSDGEKDTSDASGSVESQTNSGNGGLSTGAKVGISIAIVGLIAAAVLVVCFLIVLPWRRAKGKFAAGSASGKGGGTSDAAQAEPYFGAGGGPVHGRDIDIDTEGDIEAPRFDIEGGPDDLGAGGFEDAARRDIAAAPSDAAGGIGDPAVSGSRAVENIAGAGTAGGAAAVAAVAGAGAAGAAGVASGVAAAGAVTRGDDDVEREVEPTSVRTTISSPVRVVYDASTAAVSNVEALRLSGVEQSSMQDIDAAREDFPVHLSIALDTSALGCSADHEGGDNRMKYATAVAKLLTRTSSKTGSAQSSLVCFSGDDAIIAPALASVRITPLVPKLADAISSISPPHGAALDRATPRGAMRAVNTCIGLLRETETSDQVTRRVLVLTGSNMSDGEMQEMRAAANGGKGWRTANCVLVAAIGDLVNPAAAVQLGSTVAVCNSVEHFGQPDVLQVLKELIASESPRDTKPGN